MSSAVDLCQMLSAVRHCVFVFFKAGCISVFINLIYCCERALWLWAHLDIYFQCAAAVLRAEKWYCFCLWL